MGFSPFLSSIRIKNLFGEQDLSIDFKPVTVIVGKNGLGKTTLLKIIDSLILGKKNIDYGEICESIEIEFRDGSYICYGILKDEFIESVTNESYIDNFNGTKKLIAEVIKGLDGLEYPESITNDEKELIVGLMVKQFITSGEFVEKLKNTLLKRLEENKGTIFINEEQVKWLKNNLAVRYISTVNISANAGKEIDVGNSIEKNLLDLAIHEEIRGMIGGRNKNAINSFLNGLNSFLSESNKNARIAHGVCIFETGTGIRLQLEQLSSGERQLVYILATAANTCGKSALFLMDEPEVSLHLSWQEKLIDAIVSINPKMQLIAVTHSPGIMMNGHMDSYVEMNSILKDSKND